MPYSDLSVVMAARNEEKAIAKVIKDIQDITGSEAEIVVVDGSTDKTSIIAEELGARVIRQKPEGYGIAVKTALLAANKDIVITVDCDDTYPAEMIPEFIRLIREGYDVVSGSRIESCSHSMTRFNRFGNKLFAGIVTVLYGFEVSDVTTGMRAYRRDVLHAIDWTENTGLSAELIFRPARRGFRITEIPIPYRERLGETKLNPLTGGMAILKSIVKYRIIPP
jgi:glycosyltransferase involved in cell wall biosynthesis